MTIAKAAKAVAGGVTAFLGLLAARKVSLDPFIEATLLGIVAAASVYITRNR